MVRSARAAPLVNLGKAAAFAAAWGLGVYAEFGVPVFIGLLIFAKFTIGTSERWAADSSAYSVFNDGVSITGTMSAHQIDEQMRNGGHSMRAPSLLGVSFGGDSFGILKLGRAGKKSLEGSLAMFSVCCAVGFATFGPIRLREYPVFFGALTATLTELYEPFNLNDNLTIPVFSSLAMQWAFHRIQLC